MGVGVGVTFWARRKMRMSSFDDRVMEQENQGQIDSNERDAGIPFLCAFVGARFRWIPAVWGKQFGPRTIVTEK